MALTLEISSELDARISGAVQMLNRATPATIGTYARRDIGGGWIALELSGPRGTSNVGNWPAETAPLAIETWAWATVLMSSHVKTWKRD